MRVVPPERWVALACSLASLELRGLVTWYRSEDGTIRFKLTEKGKVWQPGAAILENGGVDPEVLLGALTDDHFEQNWDRWRRA